MRDGVVRSEDAARFTQWDTEVRPRLAVGFARSLQEHWSLLASELDPRLEGQGDWPALALLREDAYAKGHDVVVTARALVAEKPLGELPAQDLRYRLVARFDLDVDDSPQAPSPMVSSPGTAQERKQIAPAPPRPPTLRR